MSTNPQDFCHQTSTTNLDTPAGRKAEVRRIASHLSHPTPAAILGARPAAILSAMGHPGYGQVHSMRALEGWIANGGSLHRYTIGMAR